MKNLPILLITIALLVSCNKDEENVNPKAKEVEGTYVGTLRTEPGSPLVEITAKAGPDNNIILSFVHNVETGVVELTGTELDFTDYSGDDYLMFNIGDQQSGEKAKYSYSGRRILYHVSLPSRQGYFLLKPDGTKELWLQAEVTTDDNRKYMMYMVAKSK
jgi:hypothetical protein